MEDFQNKKKYPNLNALFEDQLKVFPRHEQFLRKRFSNVSNQDLSFIEMLAKDISLLANNNIETFCENYKWFSREITRESLYFNKYKSYRYKKFSEVNELVYSDESYMDKYNDGLLISFLWWENHTRSLKFYYEKYIPLLKNLNSHLEIGPGHGIYLSYTSNQNPNINLEAWDISSESIKKTSRCLKILNPNDTAKLTSQDLFIADTEKKYDSILMSEVLEHLEEPKEALKILWNLLNTDGLLFINMPVNSPAIDHIFNLPSPEDVVNLIISCGFEVIESKFEPSTNTTLEFSRQNNLNINTLVIAKKV